MVEAVNAIELKNITKRFGTKVVANDKVNLTLRKGEILSLLGENGSGKTTLMNMLSGIYFPDEGQIFVNGKEVLISSPKDSFDLGIGMIHQHFKLIEVLTAAENIILGLPGRMNLNMVPHLHLILRLMELHLLQNKKIAGAAKRGAIYDSRAARAAALLFSYRTCKRSLEVF